MYESIEDMPEDLRGKAPEGRDQLFLELINTGEEDALDRLLDATQIDLGEEDTIVVHGHQRGSTIRHKTGTFEVDDWFIQELQEGFDQITKQGYRPPLLKQHKPDPKGKKSRTRDPKGPRPIEDGFNYGRIVEVVDAPSERAEELEESHANTPDKDGVWFVAEVPGPVKQAHRAGFIQHWSPGLYRNWTPPHPSMGENIPLAPRHLAFVSVPHQKNLDTTTPQYDLEEKVVESGATVDLGETRDLQLMSLSEGEVIHLAATSHKDWPVASLEREWDASGAHDRLVDHFDADEEGALPDGFVSAHLFYPDEAKRDGDISMGKLPIVDVIDGEPQYVPAGARAADQALSGARGGVELPNSARQKVEKRLDKIYSKIADNHPQDWPENPSVLRNSDSGNEEFLMSEEYEELKEDLQSMNDAVQDLKEKLSEEEEEAEEDEKIVEMREQIEDQEEQIEELRRERLRDSLESRGVDLEEVDEDVDELMELAQTDPAAYTKKVTEAVGDGESSKGQTHKDEEVGGTGNPPKDTDPAEELEETVQELQEEGYEPGSQELMDELADRGFEDQITQ